MELDGLRGEADKYRTECEALAQELNAVNHHRTVLRDTLEQLDREVKEKVDMVSDLQARLSAAHHQMQQQGGMINASATGLGLDDSFNASLSMGGTGVGGGAHRTVGGASTAMMHTEAASAAVGEVEEGLHRQVLRYKARAAAMDELATIYRTSVLALYADGASYGAAQFGWQPHGVPVLADSRGNGAGLHLIGKNSYD